MKWKDCQDRSEEHMKNNSIALAMVLKEGIKLEIIHGGCNPMVKTEGPCSLIAIHVDCVLFS